jgi:hypothetical protein
VTAEEVEVAVTGRRVLAEDHLVEFLALAGISPSAAAGVPHEQREAEHLLVGEPPLPASPMPPSTPEIRSRAVAPGGAPKLDRFTRGHLLDPVTPGRSFVYRQPHANRGGAGHGLRIVVAGPAVERGLVVIETVAATPPGGSEIQVPWTGGPVDLDVPVPPDAGGPSMEVTVGGRALVAGHGDLVVRVSTEGDGESVGSAPIVVVSEEDLPLAAPRTDLALRWAADLLDPRMLVAGFALDPARATAAMVIDVIERFLGIPGLQRNDVPMRVYSSANRPLGLRTIRPADIGVARRWSGLVHLIDELPDLHIGSLTAEAVMKRDHGNPRRRGQPNNEVLLLTLRAGIMPVDWRPDDSGLDAAVVDDAERELRACGDELLAAGALVQGCCDRWSSSANVINSYLQIIRQGDWDGFWTELPSMRWARRYLYAVAATTWLGAELTDRVATSVPAIDELVTAIGAGVRIDAPDTAHRRLVERALPDIVPGMRPVDPDLVR